MVIIVAVVPDKSELLLTGETLWVAHAGDSRAVLCREGAAQRLTEDHKPNLARERVRIEAAGGRILFQRCWRVICESRDERPSVGLAVSRGFGDLDFKEPLRFEQLWAELWVGWGRDSCMIENLACEWACWLFFGEKGLVLVMDLGRWEVTRTFDFWGSGNQQRRWQVHRVGLTIWLVGKVLGSGQPTDLFGGKPF